MIAYNDIGEALFGDDAFSSDRVVLLDQCRKFVDTAVACLWKNMRTIVDREHTKVAALKEKVEKEWKSMYSNALLHPLTLCFITI